MTDPRRSQAIQAVIQAPRKVVLGSSDAERILNALASLPPAEPLKVAARLLSNQIMSLDLLPPIGKADHKYVRVSRSAWEWRRLMVAHDRLRRALAASVEPKPNVTEEISVYDPRVKRLAIHLHGLDSAGQIAPRYVREARAALVAALSEEER